MGIKMQSTYLIYQWNCSKNVGIIFAHQLCWKLRFGNSMLLAYAIKLFNWCQAIAKTRLVAYASSVSLDWLSSNVSIHLFKFYCEASTLQN